MDILSFIKYESNVKVLIAYIIDLPSNRNGMVIYIIYLFSYTQ